MFRPILFIHGFAGSQYEFWPIKKILKANGWDKFYEFTYQQKFGQASLRDVAWQLQQFIDEKVGEQEIDMIAISQGGIIARYQIAQSLNNKVKKCVTICSPHHGTYLAYLGMLPGIKDLRPDSPLLQELDETKADYYAIYNPLDLMVLPGWSAKMERARENKRIFSSLHQLTHWKKKTLEYILSVLSDQI